MDSLINAVVVDDEKNSRIVLQSLIKEYVPEIRVVGEASNVEEAYKVINELTPRLVFLDIQMPGGNGFNLLKQWKELPFDVIFVTSYDQYAINAIRYSALDYLLKPVEVEELKNAAVKAIKKIGQLHDNDRIIALLDNINPEVKEKKIAVHVKDKVKLIEMKGIMYIEADESYSRITLSNGEHYTTSKVLKEFDDLFAGNRDFIRIHKSCIINTNTIEEYSKGEPCIIEMRDGKQFEVARRKKQEVLERLRDKLK